MDTYLEGTNLRDTAIDALTYLIGKISPTHADSYLVILEKGRAARAILQSWETGKRIDIETLKARD